MSIFANYAKGLQVPSTDHLYNSFFFAPGTDAAQPNPETTDNFDFGVRYRSARSRPSFGAGSPTIKNRIASAFDPELERNVFRNLGTVDKYGIDGCIASQPIRELKLYVFGSWMKRDQGEYPGELPRSIAVRPVRASRAIDADRGAIRRCAPPRASANPVRRTTRTAPDPRQLGPVEFGITAKRTGPRYIYDTNQPMFRGDVASAGASADRNTSSGQARAGLLAGQSRCAPQPRDWPGSSRPTSSSTSTICSTNSMSAVSAAA